MAGANVVSCCASKRFRKCCSNGIPTISSFSEYLCLVRGSREATSHTFFANQGGRNSHVDSVPPTQINEVLTIGTWHQVGMNTLSPLGNGWCWAYLVLILQFLPCEQWHTREHSMMVCSTVTASLPSNCSNSHHTVYNTPYENGVRGGEMKL